MIIAEAHEAMPVLFADVVDSTPFMERTEPARVIGVRDEIFSANRWGSSSRSGWAWTAVP